MSLALLVIQLKHSTLLQQKQMKVTAQFDGFGARICFIGKRKKVTLQMFLTRNDSLTSIAQALILEGS